MKSIEQLELFDIKQITDKRIENLNWFNPPDESIDDSLVNIWAGQCSATHVQTFLNGNHILMSDLHRFFKRTFDRPD